MKEKIKHLLITAIILISTNLTFSQNEQLKQKFIENSIKELEMVFDGEIIGSGNSFYTTEDKVYTEVFVKVKYLNYGSITTQTIILAREGGLIDGKEVVIHDGNPIYINNTTFFVYNNFKVQNKLSNKIIPIINQIGFNNKNNIITSKIPFNNYNELLEALSTKISITFEKKKSKCKRNRKKGN